MAKIQKLYKREGKDKKTLVYPATITQAVRDGETGQNLHDYMNDIKPKFKFNATQTDSQLGTVGSIQLSQDGGKTWNPISPEFLNNLRIQGYVATASALPANKPVGTIYGVGPTYAASDSAHTNPIYRLYVYNGSSWVDNGQFTSIAAGIVQETGKSETEVMSQKATTEKLEELGSKEGMTVGFNFGGIDYSSGKIIDNNVRLYSDKIGVNKGRNIKFIRIKKPSNIILPYSETFGSYSIFGYNGDSYVSNKIGGGYVKIYDDYIRVELTNIDDINNIRIVLADKTLGEILDSDRLKCHAYIDRDAEFQNSVVPFEYGAVDLNTGDFYENKTRIRARLFFKSYNDIVDSYKHFRVNAPEGFIPRKTDDSAYVAYAYLGNTPIKRIPSFSIENNVGKFVHDGTFDNIFICYSREDNAEITEEELRQCSVETELALKNQIIEASRDILKVENKLRNDFPIAFQKIKFVYGGTLIDGGDYVNNYPIDSDTQNRIRLRSEPIFIEKNGKVRINIANYGDLKLYANASIYKGIDNVGNVQLNTKFKDFIILNKDDDSYDNIVISLMKDNNEEITEEERNSVFAYGHIGEVSTKPKEHGTLKYCALGDSITYGFIPRNAEGYPGQLKSYARLTAEKLGMNFLNYGISGSTVANKENAMSVRYTEMPSDADIITVMGGTNDQWRGVPLGTMSDRSINTFYGALHVLYQGLYTKYIANAEYSVGAKKKIIVLTPLKKLDPNKSSFENTIENNSDILMPLEDFVKAVKEVAAFYSFPVLDFYNLSGINPHLNRTVIGTESGYTGNYNPYIVDGTHPTAEGHEMMADLLVGFIRSLDR